MLVMRIMHELRNCDVQEKTEKKENGRNSGKEIMRILKRGTDLSKGTKLRVQDKFIIKYHFMLKKILYKLSKSEQQF